MHMTPTPLNRSRPGRWWRAALAVFRKEMAETFRDRRTLIAAVVLPALTMPIVVLAMPVLAQRQQATLRDRPARVAVEGEDASGLATFGFDAGALSLVSVPQPRTALLRGEIEAVLVDEGAPPGRSHTVTVLYDETRPASSAAVQKIAQVAARLALRDLEAAARARGADPASLVSVGITPQNIAPPERTGGALLATAVPFFLAVWLLLGGQYAAIDIGVGERERGSLEALLATPPSRTALAGGKFLAVLFPSLLAVAVMLAAGVITLALGARLLTSSPVVVSLPIGAVVPLLLVGVALGGLLSAAQLTISLGAGTLREAQQAFAGLYLVVALPLMLVPLLGDWVSRPWAALVPVLNAAVAFRAILAAEISPAALLATLGSLVVLTVPVFLWGARLLEGQGRAIR
jgi:sodium transport system permease protein